MTDEVMASHRPLQVTVVAANSAEFDSRLRKTARALAEDGHAVTLVAWRTDGTAAAETLADGIDVRRVALDLRLSSALRPLPPQVRRGVIRALGVDPDATVLPPDRRGRARLFHPLLRGLEVLAHLRRIGPWADAVVAAAPADVYHAKALIALPVVARAARRTHGRYVYDVADLHVEAARLARMPSFVRRLVRDRERGWVRGAAGLTAVSEAVAGEVASRYGVPKPALLLNAPDAWRPDEGAILADDGRLRRAAGLPPGRSVVLYQGGLSVDRGIEELIAALDEPPLRERDMAAVFLGYGRLAGLVAEAARRQPGRVVALEAVPPPELLWYTVGADVAYVGQPPRTLNQRLNLSNKLFESLMAGVPVVVAAGTEHARIVAQEGVGAAADIESPASIAAAIAGILDADVTARQALRGHCRRVALDRYTWQQQRAGVVELYRRIVGEARTAGRDGGPRHVALLLNNPFLADSRSWKIANSLAAAGHRVTVVARAAEGLPPREERNGFEVVRIEQPRPLGWLPSPPLPPGAGVARRRSPRDRLRDTAGRAVQVARYLLLARQWAGRIGAEIPNADIWQSEGLVTLPVALRLRGRRGGRVVYDSRDLHVESARFARLPAPWRRLLARGERRWARAADAVVTVSRPYAEVLERMLGVSPVVVMNGPVAWDPPDPPERRFHERLGLPANTRVVLHLGAIQPHRGIEELVDAIGLVEDAALVVVGDGGHKPAIQARAAHIDHADRIHLLPAAPPEELLPLNASADVHAIPVQPSTLNHRLNTPTKLFDAMGAGTPVVVSNLPGMAEIVQGAGFGVLCDPTSAPDIARAIREVLDAPPTRRQALREAALAAARGEYSWDRQARRLLELYDRLG